jgi:hypothetical protein
MPILIRIKRENLVCGSGFRLLLNKPMLPLTHKKYLYNELLTAIEQGEKKLA